MSGLSRARMEALLEPYLSAPVPVTNGGQSRPEVPSVPAGLFEGLNAYLDLLLAWNARTNLTSVRDPEQIVRRHFGESLFAARCLQSQVSEGASLLDFGSGGGFPGIPIQLWHPALLVTLAESQGKKAAFLREVVRSLGLTCAVWSARVEAMPAGEAFGIVTMRAVDRADVARRVACTRVSAGGLLLEMTNTTGGGNRIPGPEGGSIRVTRF
jgi:16S rRNA (guanine527-N7)-methyltransferase